MSKNELVTPKRVTLKDILSSGFNIIGTIEIVNECNETLVTLDNVEDNILPLDKVLTSEILDRGLIHYGVVAGRALFKVEGIEDAV